MRLRVAGRPWSCRRRPVRPGRRSSPPRLRDGRTRGILEDRFEAGGVPAPVEVLRDVGSQAWIGWGAIGGLAQAGDDGLRHAPGSRNVDWRFVGPPGSAGLPRPVAMRRPAAPLRAPRATCSGFRRHGGSGPRTRPRAQGTGGCHPRIRSPRPRDERRVRGHDPSGRGPRSTLAPMGQPAAPRAARPPPAVRPRRRLAGSPSRL